MSHQVTTAMIDMFSSNIMHLSQQTDSVLAKHCRQETLDAESKFYDRIGKRTARKKEGRHSDVVYTDTPHSRRRVTMDDYYDADLVDKEDKLRLIMNPESEYAIAMSASIARQQDEVIIEGALGNAYGGKKGATVIPLPDTQKIAAFDGTLTIGGPLNIRTLRAVRKKFKQSEAIKRGEKLIFTWAAQQCDDLLATTEATSSDYNVVRTLVNGDIDTFMGFLFEETELLPYNEAAVTYNKDTGSVGAGTGTIAIGYGRRCFAFTANSGVLCAIGSKVKGRVSEIAHKHYSNQVYASLSVGTSRMEEVQVVEVYCYEVE